MQIQSLKMQKKINIITLGCSKNTVDSEQFAAILTDKGFAVSHNSNDKDYDTAIVNTCGFINDAKEESINYILHLISAKEEGNLRKIIVFGCLAERYIQELSTELPEVDIILGNYNPKKLLAAVSVSGLNKSNQQTYNRIFESSGHYAYLKIAEGCNRTCAFCAIPLIKGKYVSRDINDVYNEAVFLANKGVREIMLIAQDLSYYGYDIDKTFKLPELAEKLSGINGIEWIRLHYLYPYLFPDSLIDVIADNPKICRYIDIPIQHISDKVMTKMKRGGTKKQILKLLDKFRSRIPELAIRTTILTGHPGEGEKEFKELMDFIEEQKFDRLGAFTYSEEEDTFSATNYKDRISNRVKEERLNAIMELQQGISLENNSKKLGKIMRVIIDKTENDKYIARSEFDSVEVDNEIILSSNEKLNPGQFCDVKITGYDFYELYAEKI